MANPMRRQEAVPVCQCPSVYNGKTVSTKTLYIKYVEALLNLTKI
jgi:hypothetical protein